MNASCLFFRTFAQNFSNSAMSSTLNTVEEALEDIKAGKVIIVVDDEDRENEGDFVIPARHVTPEIINFMATHARGLICAPLIEDRCDELGLELMVKSNQNNAEYETPFTVSVDLLGYGCTTGISASDRSKTVQALINPDTKPEELGKPGHIFPLRAKAGGVLRRTGHTEATIDIARMAGYEPAGVCVEIMNEDGTMARLPQLLEIAKRFDLKIISIADMVAYRLRHESLIEKLVDVKMPTKWGEFRLAAFRQTTTDDEHIAIYKGEWNAGDPVMVRVHSSSFTSDLLDSLRDDSTSQLQAAMQQIEREGKGMVLYMQQEGRGFGLLNKLNVYKLQEEGYDIEEAHSKLGLKMDTRDYGVGAQILRAMNVTKMRLITNNPKKRTGLIGYGLEIVENIPMEVESNEPNHDYMES